MIDCLNDYKMNDYKLHIFTEENMQNYIKHKILFNKNQVTSFTTEKNSSLVKINIDKNIKNSDIFIPKEQDTLFWCYYIMKNGDVKYETLNNKNIVITKQLKIEYISKIKEKKSIIQTYKFGSMVNIGNNLANEQFVNIKTVAALCAIDNINVVFVNNNTYFELLMNDSDEIYIIYDLTNSNSKHYKKYGFKLAESGDLEHIRDKLYKIDSLDKPIKGIASYKSNEIVNIAVKLGIPVLNSATLKNKTKTELYEAIVQYF